MAILTIEPGEHLTVAEAAALLRRHRKTITNYIRAGLLAAGRVGPRSYGIRREALADFQRRFDPEDRAGVIARLEDRERRQEAAEAYLDGLPKKKRVSPATNEDRRC